MYGTIMRLKVKEGHEQRVVDLLKEWETDRKPQIQGAVGGLLLKPNGSSGVLVGAAIFKDRASYMANADNPAQHEWYMRLRELLEDDPEWEGRRVPDGGPGVAASEEIPGGDHADGEL